MIPKCLPVRVSFIICYKIQVRNTLAFVLTCTGYTEGHRILHVAVFNTLKMYGSRVVELHLRQSVNGIWAETFSAGDIDYVRFVSELERMKLRPHLVIEQCVEDKSPNTTSARRST